MADQIETVNHNVEAIKFLGVAIALDDFGTGFSSLDYLRRFPPNTIKIDRSFVKDLKAGTNDAAIVEGIISLASKLNLTVVAEGVETMEQLQILAGAGCQEIQGYLFSPPVPANIFEKFFKAITPFASIDQAQVV